MSVATRGGGEGDEGGGGGSIVAGEVRLGAPAVDFQRHMPGESGSVGCRGEGRGRVRGWLRRRSSSLRTSITQNTPPLSDSDNQKKFNRQVKCPGPYW